MISVGEAANEVLMTADPDEKARLGRSHANSWFTDKLAHDFPQPPPDRPARPDKPRLLMPRYMPKRHNMVALLHAITHIELNAIDLAWDMVARFGQNMPRSFIDDWVRVADDEARHFRMLCDRLSSYDASYGDLPAHDGLWQSAMDTAHDLKARLAIVPLVLEARGLDVTPSIIARFDKAQDQESAQVLKIIYEEEISHVHAGQKWFKYLCEGQEIEPKQCYQRLVRQYFKGQIKPPFNTKARDQAGFEVDFYLPLAINLK